MDLEKRPRPPGLMSEVSQTSSKNQHLQYSRHVHQTSLNYVSFRTRTPSPTMPFSNARHISSTSGTWSSFVPIAGIVSIRILRWSTYVVTTRTAKLRPLSLSGSTKGFLVWFPSLFIHLKLQKPFSGWRFLLINIWSALAAAEATSTSLLGSVTLVEMQRPP